MPSGESGSDTVWQLYDIESKTGLTLVLVVRDVADEALPIG